MFMVKEEFANIRNLFLVRLKMASRSYIVSAIVLSGFYLIPLIDTVIEIINNNTRFYFNVSDISEIIIFAMIIVSIVSVILYRTTNVKLSVYPQTNNSRLISSLLVTYFTVFAVLGFFLVMYLINLGVFMLMSVFSYNIIFALNVDFRFIIAGFFVYLVYGLLIVSVIELIGAVLRKWTYYAAVILTTLFALLIINFAGVFGYLPKVFAFLVAEPSLLLFFLKATGLWLAITALTLIINRYTVFYKSHNQIMKKGTVITCIVIAAAIIVFLPGLINIGIYTGNDQDWDDGAIISPEDVFPLRDEDFSFDVSHLPAGSRINIEGTNINVMQPGQWMWSSNDNRAIVSGAEGLYDIQGDTIIVNFRPPWTMINGIEVGKYTNPQLSVHLEGNTLYIDYSVDNVGVNVIIMPIWNLARQFDYFKDMGVLSATAFGFTSGGNTSANIWIIVE
jgi:hypothetical protein